jgi:hypothetical protein
MPTAAPISSFSATRIGRRGVTSSVLEIVPWRNSLVNRRIPRRRARTTAGNAALRTRSN